MKIAITGATGIIGRYLVPRLSSACECRLLGRSIEKLENVFGNTGEYELVAVDYSKDSLNSAISGVQSVIHLAGLRPVKKKNDFSLYQENMRISGNLFETCNKLEIRNVVFASSGSVYTPGVDPAPFTEERDSNPVSFYAAGKIASEKLGLAFGLRLKSLRLASIIGLGENPEFMRMALIHRAHRGDDLFIYGDGSGQREYIYAKDAARAIELSIKHPDIADVINIGSGECMTQSDYAQMVNDVFACGTSKIIYQKEKSGYQDTRLMSCQKAGRVLGFIPEYSLKSALEDLKNDMEK